jgi:hypothetical protein
VRLRGGRARRLLARRGQARGRGGQALTLAGQRRQLPVGAVDGSRQPCALGGMRVLGAAQHAALRGGQRGEACGDVVALAAHLGVLVLDRVELTQLAQRQAGALAGQLGERGLNRAQGRALVGRRCCPLGLRGRALGPGAGAAAQLVVVWPAGRRPCGQLGDGEVLVVADCHALRGSREHVVAPRARAWVVRGELGALGLYSGGQVLAVDVEPVAARARESAV